MAFMRFLLILTTLVLFFAVGAPVQALLARRRTLSGHIPAAFCRMLLWLLRVKVELSGRPPGQGPLLFAVNHVSWIDILVMGRLRPFCFLAKKEVASWPLLSSLARLEGTVFIDRSRRRDIPAANQAMAARMSEGHAVLLFPEGTTHDGKALGRFYSSHFAAARDYLALHPSESTVGIQPIALAYSADFAAWIGDDALLPHLWRVLRRDPLTCRAVCAAPLAYGRTSDRKAVAKAARDAIELALRPEQRRPGPRGLMTA